MIIRIHRAWAQTSSESAPVVVRPGTKRDARSELRTSIGRERPGRAAPRVGAAWTVGLMLMVAPAGWGAPAGAAQVEGLTLDQALERAERQHPRLAEARAAVEAAAGRAQQAGSLPNPELILGALQLPLDEGASNQREYVAGVGQPIPLGGRLGKAREAERLEQEVRSRGLEVVRRDLRRRVHGAFATALYQDQARQALGQMAEGLEQLVAMTAARIRAGDTVAEDLARVELECLRARAELQRSQALLEQSFLALAAAIGEVDLRIGGVAGDLEATFELAAIEGIVGDLAAQPELRQAEADLRARQARLDLARAERIPDLRVEALYHRLETTRENTLDLGLSLPLPLFQRNQGRAREARAELESAQARARWTEAELAARLQSSRAQLTFALAQASRYRSEILPRAETILRAGEARYAAGDLSLAELLPVRRDWATIRLGQLEALRDVLVAWGELRDYTVAR